MSYFLRRIVYLICKQTEFLDFKDKQKYCSSDEIVVFNFETL